MIRFIRVYDDKRKRVWIVPDTRGQTYRDKRPGLGRWIRSRAEVIDAVHKEGKYKMIDNNGYWRPDMRVHVWRVLLRKAWHEWEQIMMELQGPGRMKKLSFEKLFVPIAVDNASKRAGCEGDLASLPRLQVREKCYLPGLQCVLVLDSANFGIAHERKELQDNAGRTEGRSRDDVFRTLSIPELPIVAWEPVEYVSSRTECTTMQQSVACYDTLKIWGEGGLDDVRRALPVQYKDCIALGVASHVVTKWLAVALWKLVDYVT